LLYLWRTSIKYLISTFTSHPNVSTNASEFIWTKFYAENILKRFKIQSKKAVSWPTKVVLLNIKNWELKIKVKCLKGSTLISGLVKNEIESPSLYRGAS